MLLSPATVTAVPRRLGLVVGACVGRSARRVVLGPLDRSLGEAVVKPVVRWGMGHALPRSAMGGAARRGDVHGRLVVAGGRDDPQQMVDLFDEVRSLGPVHRSQFAWFTASQPVVREVLTSNDFRTGVDFASSGAAARLLRWAEDRTQLGPLTPPSLLVTEPPDHTRYRKLVTRVFTVRAVEDLRARAEQIAGELLDALDPTDPVELVSTYCSLLPVTMIAEILGVPLEQRDRVLEYGSGAAPSLDLGLSYRRFRAVEHALRDFDRWLTAHLAHVQRHPGDDLLSQLVSAREDGVGLTDTELKSIAGLVLAAGFETTVNLLGNGIALLCEHPDQLAVLREQPEHWPNAVEEILRLDPPVLLTGRTAVRDTVVAGTTVPRGHLVTTLLAGANRDPEVFADPGRFDVTRANARDHVSFSSGRHYCLGAALARMEGEVGLRMLVERFPDLRLEPGAKRRDTRILRGYERLPARLT